MTPLTASLVVEPGVGREDSLEGRVARQRDALLELTTHSGANCEDLAATLMHITEVVSDTLGVPRVSIWRYNMARTAIDCLDLFDRARLAHSPGASLRATEFPNYFRVIAESDVVAVDDAVVDARTSEFAAAYLAPLDIVSMMDVPIRLGGAVIGILCHEQTGRRRHWTDDEKAFAISTSTLISLALERCERRRVESALELQSAALNAVAHPAVITNCDAQIVWVNPSFTAMLGYTPEEAAGRNSIELLSAGRHNDTFFTQMWDAVRAGQIWRGEIWNRTKHGRLILFDQTVTPVKDSHGRITHFVAIKVDLTEKKNLEAQVLQAQKMEVVGRLAGGIAHDFNNLLTVINGSAELALSDLAADHPLRLDFERIQESGLRAAGLTRQLLSFSRKQVVNRNPLEISRVLIEFRNMLQRLIGEDIRLEVSAAAAGLVIADQSQFEQVILNLAINARDAMPRGGALKIATSDVVLDAPAAAACPGLKPGPYVRITVADTGDGMSPEIQAKIFEPFFTTKEQGKGTGLGLATVCSVIEQTAGCIEVASGVGAGTTFTIHLPSTERIAAADQPARSEPMRKQPSHLLFVEQDDAVRDLGVAALRSAGYVTRSAGDGASALRMIADGTGPLDLLVTDAVLPDMTGPDLASRASRIRPSIRVVYTCGYLDNGAVADAVRRAPFVTKPYAAPALINRVRELLPAQLPAHARTS